VKKKDLISLVVAVFVFVAVGYVAYTQLGPKGTSSSSGKGVDVVVITPIPSHIDPSQITQLNDPNVNVNYYQTYTFDNLGNSQPFGQ
jgi:hypothetical protein